MADASELFEKNSIREAPFIDEKIAKQLAIELRLPELRKPIKGVEENIPGRGLISRVTWEIDLNQLEAIEWDLTPRRREKGNLERFLENIKQVANDSLTTVNLESIAEVFSGQVINKMFLLDQEPQEYSASYIRIRDIHKHKITKATNWLEPTTYSKFHKYGLKKGDILLSKSGTIGKTAIVEDKSVGSITASGLYTLRAVTDELYNKYLLAYLESKICQKWLAAHASGTVINHLNLKALKTLPILLPSIDIQRRVAENYNNHGIDAFTSLLDIYNESDHVNTWLSELDAKVPRFDSEISDIPDLSHFDSILLLVKKARDFEVHDQNSVKVVNWLVPQLYASIKLLNGVSQIPQGPGLFNILREAQQGIKKTITIADGSIPSFVNIRDTLERINEWLELVISKMLDSVELELGEAPSSLKTDELALFKLELVNKGSLPIRNVWVKTAPDWGSFSIPYIDEFGCAYINLDGQVPKEEGSFSISIEWEAELLNGNDIFGAIELPLKVINSDISSTTIRPNLEGSPYVTGSPLEPHVGQDIFYGREELINKISRHVSSHGNVVLLEGNRRSGKTSILKHIEGCEVIPGWIAIYASLQGAEGATDAVGVPTAEVFREIARSIATAVTKLDLDVPLPNGNVIVSGKPALGIARACREGISTDAPFADFRDYLELILEILDTLNLGLVLMLDEFDKLQEGIDNGVTSPQVPENIRFLIQTYTRFSAILTGSRRLKRLREEYWSALYGLGTSIPVLVLDEESARKVVTQPVINQLAYSNEAIERVINITSRHPYLMQCLCNRIYDFAVQTKSNSININIVNQAASGLVRDNEHFASLWDYAGFGPEDGKHRRQLILFLFALSFKHGTHISFGTLHEQLTQEGVEVSDEALDIDLAYLRELELIDLFGEIGDGEYRLSIPMMADWIEQHQDADVVTSRARTEAEEEDVR